MNLNERRGRESSSKNSTPTTTNSPKSEADLIQKQQETIREQQEKIQELSSDKQKLTEELQKTQQTVQNLSGRIEKLSKSDKELKDAERIKREAEEKEKETAETAKNLSLDKEELDKRESSIARREKNLAKDRKDFSKKVNARSDQKVKKMREADEEKLQKKKDVLQEKYNARVKKMHLFFIILAAYSCAVTIAQVIIDNRCRNDIGQFFLWIWKALVWLFVTLPGYMVTFSPWLIILLILYDFLMALLLYYAVTKLVKAYKAKILRRESGWSEKEIQTAETQVAIAAAVPAAVLAWFGKFLPEGLNTTLLYVVVEILYTIWRYRKQKENIRSQYG